MPIGKAGDPHIGDFMNPKVAPAAKTHHLLRAVHQIRKASLTADFSGELNYDLEKRLRGSDMRSFLRAKRFHPGHKSENRRRKALVRNMGNYWKIWERICASSFRGSYLEVDLDDMRSENRLLCAIGRDAELQLHIYLSINPRYII